MTVGEGATAGQDQPLRDDYRKLADLPISNNVTHLLDEDKWVESNRLLRQGQTEAEVAEQVEVNNSVVIMVSNARRCLERYRGNPEALRRCLDGDESS
jgi:hypothetical protein